jgi:L-aspartate oxidase
MTPTIVRALPGAAARALPAFEDGADVVVVGTGAAGMSAALEAAAAGLDVLVVSKAALGGGSTPWAQGGLAAALDPSDSAEVHAADTVTAGAGLGEPDAIDVLVRAAPAEIARLTTLGAHFDRGPLGLEGGHSRPRIVHAGGDASGAEVHRVLAEAVLAATVRAGVTGAGFVAPRPRSPRAPAGWSGSSSDVSERPPGR